VAAVGDADDGAQFVSMYQKQPDIYPRAVKGWFATWRWALVWLTQLMMFHGMPWLLWDGRQALLFDLEARRFFILGLVLYPQDLIFLAALLVLSALALFFFTAVAGRLWCGYTCPQTVYTEIFMWVERRFEGDRIARMRLDPAPWSGEKAARAIDVLHPALTVPPAWSSRPGPARAGARA
jgi:polyferredoxin